MISVDIVPIFFLEMCERDAIRNLTEVQTQYDAKCPNVHFRILNGPRQK